MEITSCSVSLLGGLIRPHADLVKKPDEVTSITTTCYRLDSLWITFAQLSMKHESLACLHSCQTLHVGESQLQSVE